MLINDSTPAADGYHMPGEFEHHTGCIMIWPGRPGSWGDDAAAARAAFAHVAEAIADSETVYMLSESDMMDSALTMLSPRIHVMVMPSDDSWARDVGPTFVVHRNPGKKASVRGINWRFNAWGGEFDGLYPEWDKDDALAASFCNQQGFDYYDAAPFVLEGGSIHCDGEGTLITTKSCLLSKGRNPDMDCAEIEERLKQYLCVKKIIWLPDGIYNDETNGHIDNICAFTRPGEVVLAWTNDINDPQYQYSKAALDVLENTTDACGRNIRVHKLPIPAKPVTITDDDLKNLIFEDGEAVRSRNERLAASYVNFYISNGGIIMPAFDDENDIKAFNILQNLFPEKKIYQIPARAIITGGGNIHCITQQIP